MSSIIKASTGLDFQTNNTTALSIDADQNVSVNSLNIAGQAVSGYAGFKNRIINGDMKIAQRGTSISGLQDSPAFLIDRWVYRRAGSWTTASFTYSQEEITDLDNFCNALKITVAGNQDPNLTETFADIEHSIEGYNFADFNSGTANAKPLTISFWVKSSIDGTFSVNLNTTSDSYVTTYTINSPNTWEKKIINVAPNTLNPTNKTNGTGLAIRFALSGDSFSASYIPPALDTWYDVAGGAYYRYSSTQTNLAGTVGATFYLTGVQIEKGDTATSFDYRPYGTELALCQRYFGIYNAVAVTSANTYSFALPTTMRAAPTCTTTVNSGAGSAFSALGGGVSLTAITQSTANNALATATVNCNAEL